MRTDQPVWETGYSFLVNNPENDTIQFKIFDQKTTQSLGSLTYVLSQLLQRDTMEIRSQPFQLQNSGPESRLLMSMRMRILKRFIPESDSEVTSSDNLVSTFNRAASIKKDPQVPLKKQESRISTTGTIDPATQLIEEEAAAAIQHVPLANASPSGVLNDEPVLLQRLASTVSSAGADGLGRILLTLHFSVQKQRLRVDVHKINNIPCKDPSNIPDPYVKLYLLPSRSKESKRKTNVVKDNCDPVYEQNFEYVISPAELNSSTLEVTVCTQKGFLSGGSPVIGMVITFSS